MVTQMKKTTMLMLTTIWLQARRGRVEKRNRQEASKSNDWDERMAKEELLARRITQLLQRVDVPQVGFQSPQRGQLEPIISSSINDQVTLDLDKKEKDAVAADVKKLLAHRLNLAPAST